MSLLRPFSTDSTGANPGRVVYLMNLDYRRGQLDFADLNWDKNRYEKAAAFERSQLANMLALRAMAKEEDSKGVVVRSHQECA